MSDGEGAAVTSGQPIVPPGPLLETSPRRVGALFRGVDAAGIAVFRVAFGGILLSEIIRYLVGGHVEYLYAKPDFHFTFYGFDWVAPWPGVGMYVHFVVLGILAALLMVGLLYRVAAILFFLGFTYVFLLEQAYYLNHFYLVCLLGLLLVFIPADRAFSVRRWLRPGTPRTLPAWTLWLLRAQIGIVYFYAGVAKLNGDWLRGEPMRSFTPGLPAWARGEVVVYLISYGGLLFDLLVVPFLLWRKSRPIAFAVALVFHLANAFFLPFQIGIFPWYMIAATTLFFEPDWPRRAIAGLRRLFHRRSRSIAAAGPIAADAPVVSTGALHRRFVLILGGAYLVIQILLPLRHHLYPGDPGWTEEGNNFAWRMMIYNKQPEARFFARDPTTDTRWELDPSAYLSDFQRAIMPLRPDMILQFCHRVADDLRARGHENAEIRAYIKSSFNGRRNQLYVDPMVDLARESRSLRPKTWIKPLVVPFDEKKPVIETPSSYNGWAGFEIGSWVLVDEELTYGDTTVRARRKRQLESVGGVKMVAITNVSSDADGASQYGALVLGVVPAGLDMRLVETVPSRFSLGSREVPCEVETYAMHDEDDPWKARLSIWRSSDARVPYREAPDARPRLIPGIGLPSDVVRMTFDLEDRLLGEEGTYEIQVEDPAVDVHVGDRTLVCVHESCTISRRTPAGQTQASVDRWLSREVPNHIVKAVVRVSRGGRKTVLESTVIDFGVAAAGE